MRAALEEAGVGDAPAQPRLPRSVGNNVQVVDYRDIQFTKTPEVLRALGLEGPEKSEKAGAARAGIAD